jgi:c-di-AMP phosphodiesterase-like protein
VSAILATSIVLAIVLTGLALFLFTRLRKSQSQIEIMRQKSRAREVILDNAHFAIAMSKDRKIVWANPYFTTMLGWTSEDYL